MTEWSDHERPHLNSYWVRPGLLLAGEYPGAFEEAWARRKVRRMLEVGIRVFVDLTEEGELAPYDYLVREEARALGVDGEHLRFPIRDVCIPEAPEHVETTLDAIDAALDEGRAGAEIFVKLEWENPTGSVKDRMRWSSRSWPTPA